LLGHHSSSILREPFRIFPEQQEITYSAGLYAHNMLGVMLLDDKKFIVNPHMFSKENELVDIAKEPLYINQSDFAGGFCCVNVLYSME
jgi:hypothetical protein